MMKARTALCLLALAAAIGASAGEKPAERSTWLKAWFQNLKAGLAQSSVEGRRQRTRVTAVAAVRGNLQDQADPAKPGWKGGAQERKAAGTRKERREFEAAVDLLLAGKTAEGTAALEAFEKGHPKSSLLPDVREALEKAKEMGAP